MAEGGGAQHRRVQGEVLMCGRPASRMWAGGDKDLGDSSTGLCLQVLVPPVRPFGLRSSAPTSWDLRQVSYILSVLVSQRDIIIAPAHEWVHVYRVLRRCGIKEALNTGHGRCGGLPVRRGCWGHGGQCGWRGREPGEVTRGRGRAELTMPLSLGMRVARLCCVRSDRRGCSKQCACHRSA